MKVTGSGARTAKLSRFSFDEGLINVRFKARNVAYTLRDASGKVRATSSIGCWGYLNSVKKSPTAVEETIKGVMRA